jgi:hypothetical protein
VSLAYRVLTSIWYGHLFKRALLHPLLRVSATYPSEQTHLFAAVTSTDSYKNNQSWKVIDDMYIIYLSVNILKACM